MLRTRILTALVLLPAAYLLVFHTSPRVFAWITAGLLLVGTWEFRRLASLGAGGGVVLVLAQVALLATLARYWQDWSADPLAPFMWACTAWLLLLAQLYRHRPDQATDRRFRLRGTLNALVAITLAWVALSWLRQEPEGRWWLLTLLLVIWAADVGAYFTGRAFGKHRLAPAISPGKTREGLYGGLLLAALVAALAAWLLPQLGAAPLALALVGVTTALVSVGGDLFISMHKRTVGVKDSGRIFPGHGGVLDRLDSLLAGAPFFALGKLLAGF